MDGGAWWAVIYGVTQSWTRLKRLSSSSSNVLYIPFKKKDFFLMWTIFKVFIEFVTMWLLSYVLIFWLRGMWDLSSQTRDPACRLCIGRRSLNH